MRETDDAVPTEVQALIIESASSRSVLVGADLIWFASDQAEALRTEIARRAKCERDCVSLCATHTHGKPNPDVRFAYGQCSDALIEHVNACVLGVVEKALSAPSQAVRVARGRARAPGVSINRRREAWLRHGLRLRRRVQNLPNPWRPVDDRVTVLVFLSEASGRAVALITHYACHPVADPADRRGADFPGFLRRDLRRQFGAELVSVFLQGFCGDVRPALLRRPHGVKDRLLKLVIGDRFRPSVRDDAARIGATLAARVEEAVAQAQPLDFAVPEMRRNRVALADIDGSSTGRDLDVTVWRWSENLRLVFASGEMLGGLAPPDPDTLAVGYANGMVVMLLRRKIMQVAAMKLTAFWAALD